MYTEAQAADGGLSHRLSASESERINPAPLSDWRFSQLSIGLAAWALLLPAVFLVRRAPPAARAERRVAEAEITVRQALTSPQFAVLARTHFLCCATHSGPLFHTVSYAISCGLPVMAAVSIYSVEGLSGLAGSQQAEFYAVAVVFGFAYAGVMPLYAVLVRENFPVAIIGTVVGAASMASSLGMALGPLAGGVIFDTYGSYGPLYIGTFLIGLAAAVLMLTFRSAQRSRVAVAAG